jgi:hypothetical protein
MKNIIFYLLLLFTVKAQSQNTFFIGNKKYKTTQEWTFQTEASMDNNPRISVGKDSNKGLLIITAFTMGIKIGGTLIIYLEDETIITCKDRGINDVTNHECTTVYYLTLNEIESLKKSKIMNIRYNVISSQYHKDSFIAKNFHQNFSISEFINKKIQDQHTYWDTEIDISNLFD